MGIINKTMKKIGFAPEEYTYQCDDCGEQFESTVASTALVKCSQCGADSITKLTGGE